MENSIQQSKLTILLKTKQKNPKQQQQKTGWRRKKAN